MTVRKLNAEISARLVDAAVKERLLKLGVTLLPGAPAGSANRIALETENWTRVIKLVSIRPN